MKSKTPNRTLWRSDLLPNYCEFCLVASGLSHEPDTSDRTRIRLQASLKRTLEQNCELQ